MTFFFLTCYLHRDLCNSFYIWEVKGSYISEKTERIKLSGQIHMNQLFYSVPHFTNHFCNHNCQTHVKERKVGDHQYSLVGLLLPQQDILYSDKRIRFLSIICGWIAYIKWSCFTPETSSFCTQIVTQFHVIYHVTQPDFFF